MRIWARHLDTRKDTGKEVLRMSTYHDPKGTPYRPGPYTPKVSEEEAWAMVEKADDMAYRRVGGTGWVALGRGGTAWAHDVMQVAEALGLRQVGYGRPIEGPIYYLPTGSVSPGGPSSRMKHYFGRWQLAPHVPWSRTITEWRQQARQRKTVDTDATDQETKGASNGNLPPLHARL